MKKLIYLTLVLLLAACSAVPQSEMDQNLTKWQDAGITHYKYDLLIGCFCVFRDEMPLTIEVQDGEVVSITKATGSLVDETDPNYEFFQKYATLDRLFAALAEDTANGAAQVTVSYDSQYGFPVESYIDQSQEIADDELSLQVSNFQVLE